MDEKQALKLIRDGLARLEEKSEKPKKKKKSGWKYWHSAMGKKKPKEGTYTDLQYYDVDMWDVSKRFDGPYLHRYKKVK